MVALGIDIGATRTKLAVVETDTAEIQWSSIVSTPQFAEGDAFLDWLEQLLRATLREQDVERIGVGVAGFVEYGGSVVHSPNIPALRQIPLQTWLQQRFRLPVRVDNDANVAAWAEYRAGVARDVTDFLYVTLGTGVGGALVLGGRLWRGVHGGAGEIGHMVVDLTASGQAGMPLFRVGVVEEYVGQAALLRCAQSVVRRYPASLLASRPVTMETLAEANAAADEAAQECITWVGWITGLAIVSAIALLDVEVVVVGGGSVEAFPNLLSVAQATVRQRALPALAERVQLRAAHFGSWAGAIGAALLSSEGEPDGGPE
ncbi:MAG: ROK family protein [Chlorobiota bacterium]